MRPRGNFGGKLSLAFGAALLSILYSAPMRAREKVAFVEIGLGDSHARAACEDRGAAKGRGRCAAQPAAPTRLERPLFAVVSIADQSVSIYNHQGLVTRSAVSTGMAGHDTPKGIFTIIGRERMHASNIYSGAPMPYMQRLTWSGIAMHLGVVPGYPASHGCIRLPADFAAKLWGMTRIGERVVIAPHDVTPTEFAHSLLPAPKMLAMAEAGAPASPQAADSGAGGPALLNPHEYAQRLKARAVADRKAAAKADADAFLAADGKETDALRLAEELKAAESALAAAQARADAAERAFETAEAGAKEAAATARAKAEEERVDASARRDAAKNAVETNIRETAEAYRRWDETAKAYDAARNAERDAEFRTAPVSVLISKADNRVYVRQGLAPVFDAPANVRDPGTPLGSHLYIATAADGASLKWSVVSLAPQSAGARAARRKGRSSSEESYDFASSYSSFWAGPEEALERVEISQDVRDRIAERLWTGASIIISDGPLSNETNNVGVDLVVTLR